MNQLMILIFLVLLNISNPLSAQPIAEDQPLDWNDPKWAWMDEQISYDFRGFEWGWISDEKSGLTEQMIKDVVAATSGRLCFVGRFQVIDREVYGPELEAKRLLQKIAKLYPVPDVDVVIYGQDIILDHGGLPGPILVTCTMENGQSGEKQILFPSQLWELWVHFAQEVEKSSAKCPWENKIPKYFWRGKPNDASNYSDRELWTKHRRGKFCYFSKQFPELIDATFSSYWESSLGGIVEEFFNFFPKKVATFDEYVQHKYLIELDGYVAGTPGCAWKLLSNCAVFKHDSPFMLWYYRAMRPWVHYIPLKGDLSDVFEKLQWAKDHDEEAKQIAENGRRFAKENIMPEHLYLYCYKVLVKYASLQCFSPKKP